MAVAFKTKNVAVYEAIRKEIVDGRLKPGQKIIMSDLAKRFELSEIPVREALRRLESDDFVAFTPHVGAVVSKIDENRDYRSLEIKRLDRGRSTDQAAKEPHHGCFTEIHSQQLSKRRKFVTI